MTWPMLLHAALQDPSASSPANWYPGFRGGAIWYKNKLCCKRSVCTPGWRKSCGDSAFCQSKHCRDESAPDGSICDINPCIQGNCYKGVCMGGSGATCPSHTNECRKVSVVNAELKPAAWQQDFLVLPVSRRPHVVTEAK
jgi:hypothetical protein